MERELWLRAEELFHAALERPPESRRTFLDEACGEDAELRRYVEVLVSADEHAGSLLDLPLLADGPDTPNRCGSLVGRQFAQYRILSLLGAGGMGEVYRAHDGKLDRDVAIKTLPAECARDPERLARFRREARALAALNHPNIASIYGLEETAEQHYLVMELVVGETLEGPLPLATALDLAGQVAEALRAAHEHGIIHRDLKPRNIKVTPQGRVKVLDFGLAKAIWGTEARHDPAQTTTVTRDSGVHIRGTPAYISPEQARGGKVDQRTDIWAFGCLLYELLSGKRAFAGETVSDTIAAVLEHEPDWRALPAETPARVRGLLRRCLEKDFDRRPKALSEVLTAIEKARAGLSGWRSVGVQIRRPRFAIPLTAVFLLLGSLALRAHQHSVHARWVRDQATPEIRRLLDARELPAAFRLMRRAEAVLPNDPTLQQIHHQVSLPISFLTNPPGAEVWAAGYDPADNDWILLGKTPFTSHELLLGCYRFRIAKPGFQTILGADENRGGGTLTYDLDREGALPPEMVRVPGGIVAVPGLDQVKLGAFLIDRYEITNRQYKQFIDSGGYRKRQYWRTDFIRNGRKLSFEEAMQVFRDSTGREGPSTWELGDYPQGHDDYPVDGVSWYEAAAYADFAGKQLPTIYHWQQAAHPGLFAEIVGLSNFRRAGPSPVGSYKGLGAFGTFDMAGNVEEWCWNEIGGRRYIRGGAWNEPSYMYLALEARPPWDRSAQNGIRCVRYDASAEAGLQAPVTTPVRDYTKAEPMSEEVFRLIYRTLYAFDPRDLDARVEGIDEENSYWKREKVSFTAPHGNERVSGYFYIPKHATPPYQTIIYAPPGLSTRLPSPQPGEGVYFDFVVKSGRAFLLPVLKGYYQRRYLAPPGNANEQRDRLILESKDFRRSIDYLVSRPDVDRGRVGVLALSRGGGLPVLAAGEQRLKAAVCLACGLTLSSWWLPEDDPFNFLPRFQVPTLMANGRADYINPLETSIRPMFRRLGAPEKDKRLLLLEGYHAPLNYSIAVKETLDWFDRYLGPVK